MQLSGHIVGVITRRDKVKGYKGFDKDLKCRGFQYEIGKEYEHKDEVKTCESGFHFCEYPLDVFGYYPPADSRYCEVEGSGEISRDSNDSKVACSKLKVGVEIGLRELIDAGVKFILEKADWKNAKESNNGGRSVAMNTGDRSVAMNNGGQSVAMNTGEQSVAMNNGGQSVAMNAGSRSVATNTGNLSVAMNAGEQSVATNTGNLSVAMNAGEQSVAMNTGYLSVAMNAGEQSVAMNTGYRSGAMNTGNRSVAMNTGDRSVAMNNGYCSTASVEGKESIAIATGFESKAKGSKGCWIVLSEWECRGDGSHIKDVQIALVDGKKIEADTWYMLKDGQFVECDHE
jgi:hypothetical protein